MLFIRINISLPKILKNESALCRVFGLHTIELRSRRHTYFADTILLIFRSVSLGIFSLRHSIIYTLSCTYVEGVQERIYTTVCVFRFFSRKTDRDTCLSKEKTFFHYFFFPFSFLSFNENERFKTKKKKKKWSYWKSTCHNIVARKNIFEII